MEPKVSLTLSQHPAVCPYPEPYQSNPHPTDFFKNHSVFPSKPKYPKWSPWFKIPHQNLSPPLPHTWYMPRQLHWVIYKVDHFDTVLFEPKNI
jgi:hypothetical protein